MRISAVDDPACWFKAAYRESVPAKSIFIHPEDYRTVGKAALVVLKPNKATQVVSPRDEQGETGSF